MRLGIVASAVVAAASLPALAYQGTTIQTAVSTTYTFSGVAIGAAAADRKLVICVQGPSGAATTITSVKVNGVAATIEAVTNASSGVRSVFAHIDVPAGTSATIEVIAATALQRCHLSVYSITGLASGTPVDVDANVGAASTSLSISSIDTLADGVGIAAFSCNAATTTAWTWAGSVEDSDSSGSAATFSTASKSGQTGAAETVTATIGSSAGLRISAITWR